MSPLYTDEAKPLKEPWILRAEQELRQRGAGRRDQDLGAKLPRAEERQSTTWRRTWQSEVKTGSSRIKAFVNA
eukprot:1977819-Pleurochrysis_carterae.AAC.1